MTNSSIHVMIVDDHLLLREMLAHLLGIEPDMVISGSASSADAAVVLAGHVQPDVVLLDVEMPGNEPIRTVRRLTSAAPGAKVIILSMHDDSRLVTDLVEVGIKGYLHKGVSRAELTGAIRSASQDDGRRVVVSVPREAFARSQPPENVLSRREQEVLTLVAQAMSNRQVAAKLAITEGTVKRHLRNVFRKLDAVSRIDAVNKATAAALMPDRISA